MYTKIGEHEVWVYSLRDNVLIRERGTVIRRVELRKDGTSICSSRANLKIEGRDYYINCSSDEWDIYGGNLWCIQPSDARAIDIFMEYELKKVDELNRMLATHELRIKSLLQTKRRYENR